MARVRCQATRDFANTVLVLFAPLLVTLIELGRITLSSDVACPATDAVVTQVQRLLGEHASSQPLAVQLRDDDGVVVLERRDGAGRLMARRRLDAASCDERARTAAILIAAWTIPEAPIEDSLDETDTDSASARAAPSRPPRRLAVEGSLGFFGAFDRNGFAPGGNAELSLGEQRSGWASRLGFFGTGPRSIDFGGGAGSFAWERHTFYTGVRYRFVAAAHWRVDLAGDLLFGLLHVAGRGLEINNEALAFDFGVGGGVRVSRAWGRVAPFVALSVAGSLLGATAVIGNSFRSKSVPTVDGLLTVGVSYANF